MRAYNPNVERGYTRILESALRHKFIHPYLIFDTTFRIRFVSSNFTGIFRFKSEDEILGKRYAEFISNDLYETALRELAYRIGVLNLEDDAKKEKLNAHKRAAKLREDFEDARKTLSCTGKVADIRKLIHDYRRKPGSDVEKVDSDVRVRLGDNSVISIKDRLWLAKNKTDDGWQYGGSLVELDTSQSDLSIRESFKRWLASWSKLPEYNIKDEYVITFESLEETGDFQMYLPELNDKRHRSSSGRLVLDFREVSKTNLCDAVAVFVRDLALEDKLIIGNASEEIRSSLEKYFKKVSKETKKKVPLNFHKLVYPTIRQPELKGSEDFRELRTWSELENHVEEGLCELEGKNADKISEQSVPEVPSNTERKSDDIRSSGEGA